MIDVAGFEDDSITNGPGLRFVLFVQGCPHHCKGCHNPETWAFGEGCKYSVEEIHTRIRRNPLLRGVTFSGGEPFSQAAELARLGRLVKADGYELAVYTGFTFEELYAASSPAVHELLEQTDVLVDGCFELLKRNLLLRFRGSSNQRVLDVPASLRAGTAVEMPFGRWRTEGR